MFKPIFIWAGLQTFINQTFALSAASITAIEQKDAYGNHVSARRANSSLYSAISSANALATLARPSSRW